MNGELLKAAEQGRFEALLTTDKNMDAQQNLKTRAIAASRQGALLRIVPEVKVGK